MLMVVVEMVFIGLVLFWGVNSRQHHGHFEDERGASGEISAEPFEQFEIKGDEAAGDR